MVTSLIQLRDNGDALSLEDISEPGNSLLKDIQFHLKRLGLYSFDVDGIYGPRTDRALSRFCSVVALNNMETQLFGPTFATKLLEAKPDQFRGRVGNASGLIRPTQGPISSEFGFRIHPITGRNKLHAGIDIAGPIGRGVHSAGDGEVIFAQTVQGYGRYIEVDHGDGLVTAYAHLSTILASVGQSVQQSEKIGLMGDTGNVTGPHLHFEVHLHGAPQNPRHFVNF